MADLSSVERIQTPKIAHIVADRLRRQIITGQLQAGDTLPPEAHLMAQLGISRPALREALRILEAESLIAIGRGIRGGATILKPTVEKVAQYGTFYLVANGTTLRDIHEARTLIEPAIVKKHASEPQPELLEKLETCVKAGNKAVAERDWGSAMLASNEFHVQLVRHASNKSLVLLEGILHEIAVGNYLFLESGTDDAVKERLLSRSFENQGKLVELIRAKDTEGAEQHWRDYMERGARVLAKTGHAGEKIKLQAE
ncbi:MAG: GntR family transcriptional regulator [Rhodocyclaceae bacterium]|jgi:DNA-binding FadR family transcriptional regulator|nr:GntR family transcriptional regulator [Rhodocyclaceae bacterium]